MTYVGEDSDTKRMMERMKASKIEEANKIRHNNLNNKKVKEVREIKINGKMVLIGTLASLALLAAIIGTKKHNDKMERMYDHSETNYAFGETIYHNDEYKPSK